MLPCFVTHLLPHNATSITRNSLCHTSDTTPNHAILPTFLITYPTYLLHTSLFPPLPLLTLPLPHQPRSPDLDRLSAGKRSIIINSKKPEGADILRRLCDNSDVLIDPYRPGQSGYLLCKAAEEALCCIAMERCVMHVSTVT